MGVGRYPSLMGSFSFHALVFKIGSSLGRVSTSLNLVSFCTSHMEDPWILPSPSTLSDNSIPSKTDMSFLATLMAYQDNLDHFVEPSTSFSKMDQEDPYVLHYWSVDSSHSQDFLDDVFPSDEAILETVSGIEQPWGELHHRSYFLPKLDHLECDEFREILSEKIGSPVVSLSSPS